MSLSSFDCLIERRLQEMYFCILQEVLKTPNFLSSWLRSNQDVQIIRIHQNAIHDLCVGPYTPEGNLMHWGCIGMTLN